MCIRDSLVRTSSCSLAGPIVQIIFVLRIDIPPDADHPSSHCEPTPTLHVRCRKAQRKRWAISWRKSCKKAESVGEDTKHILSDAL